MAVVQELGRTGLWIGDDWEKGIMARTLGNSGYAGTKFRICRAEKICTGARTTKAPRSRLS